MVALQRKPAPKTAKGKRAMKEKDSKVIENTKSALFIRTASASQVVLALMQDLLALKKPHATFYARKNTDLYPFEETTKIEEMLKKHDASLFMLGSHQKKRPHNMIIGRTFNNQTLDMIELGVKGGDIMESFKTLKPAVGNKPFLLFSSPLFETSAAHMTFKSLMMDFYRGSPEFTQLNLAGVSHLMSFTVSAEDDQRIHLRVFTPQLKKTGMQTPRVEIEEVGPRIDWEIRRHKQADEQMLQQSLKVAKEIKNIHRTEKNVEYEGGGDFVARVHVGKQDLDKLQTRKVKALRKSKKWEVEEDDEQHEDHASGEEDGAMAVDA